MKGPISHRSKKLVIVVALALAAGGFLGNWAISANSRPTIATPTVTFAVAPDRAAEHRAVRGLSARR